MVDVVADAVSVGAPRVGSSSQAVELIGVVERARRLMAVSAVDVLDQIHTTGSFYEHGHANARVMFAHVAGVSGTESHRLDQIRRMISEAEHIAKVWRQADLSVDKAVLLGRAFANPRTRHRFLLDQVWLLKQARRDSVKRFTRTIARWVELHDVDGTNPGADPSFERRNAWLSQDHFSKTWKLDAELGSIQGSLFNQTLDAYIEAEFAKDWAEAEKLHGTDVCTALLARTNAQRSADALCQIAADAINSNKPSAPVKRVHNICWTAETFEELCRRWTSAPAQPLDPGTYNISDLDGNPSKQPPHSPTVSFRRSAGWFAAPQTSPSTWAPKRDSSPASPDSESNSQQPSATGPAATYQPANAKSTTSNPPPEAGKQTNKTPSRPAKTTTASKRTATPSPANPTAPSPSPPQTATPFND